MSWRSYESWAPTDEFRGFEFDLTTDGGWQLLRDYYLPLSHNQARTEQAGAAALDRTFEVARQGGAVSVYVEWRYVDQDYRSEYSNYYSTTFERHPSVCHRLHFFSESLTSNLSNLPDIAHSYVGYAVMRPVSTSPVGRTMLPSPGRYAQAAVLQAHDFVNLNGYPLIAKGMPFTAQDGQYLRCSHSAIWMASLYSHLVRATPRFLPHDIQQAGIGGEVVGRQTPHDGMSPSQLLSALHNLGFSSGRVPLLSDKRRSRHDGVLSVPASVCRYVNGSVPTIVYNQKHAWLCVGYYFDEKDGPTHDGTRFLVHDDVRGPYLTIDEFPEYTHLDPWTAYKSDLKRSSSTRRWRAAVPVLPQKVYITAERAERLGRERLEFVAAAQGVSLSDCRFRTYLVKGSHFKTAAAERLPPLLSDTLRTVHLPRHVWVVEAIREETAVASSESVVAEAVIDTTAHHLAGADSRALLARRLLGHVKARSLDHGLTLEASVESDGLFRSGCLYPTNPIGTGEA